MKNRITKSRNTCLVLATLFLCLSILTCVQTTSANTPERTLPDIPGWTGDNAETRTLLSEKEEEGRMTERSYRKNGRPELVRAIMLEGPGTEWLSFPKNHPEGSDGPAGTGATYKTLEILGKDAILENHPVLGYSLAVRLDTESTLTIETKAEETLLLDFARNLLELLTE
ncbi:MAG: hypothetical protein ACLFN0_03525 [Thermovirgaceae bacterium]